MIFGLFILLVVVPMVVTLVAENSVSGWIFFAVGFLCWVAGVAWHLNAPEVIAENKAKRASEAAQQAADRIPHVIREADGCKVYAFESGGRFHYFTRCPDSHTTTESSWQERQGKTYVTKTETIETN